MTKKQKTTPKKIIPVTLLSGFLGAGKTTLLKNILRMVSEQSKERIAVIVNDMASLNIDASLIQKTNLIEASENIVKLQNGCICCTLRVDLFKGIQKLCESGECDYIIVESTGVAEPQQVAETFSLDLSNISADTNGFAGSLSDIAKLDTCVTLVDMFDFYDVSNSILNVHEKFNASYKKVSEENGDETKKDISNLLIDQLEFADVIILNKQDLVSPNDCERIKAMVKSLNPLAKILTTSHAKVTLEDVMHTNLFSLERACLLPKWLQSIKSNSGEHPHSESDEYGISSFVYNARRPFHPKRLYDWICQYFVFNSDIADFKDTLEYKLGEASLDIVNEKARHCGKECKLRYGMITRSKGFAWLASRDEYMCEWSSAGRLVSLTPSLPWFADEKKENWNISDEEAKEVEKAFLAPFGDRRQELVFIGSGLNIDLITSDLNNCLLSNREMIDCSKTSLGWKGIEDPLPNWSLSPKPGIWNAYLQRNKVISVSLSPGCNLHLDHLLLQHANLADPFLIRVWMSYNSSKILIGILRSGIQEQMRLSIDVTHAESDGDDDTDLMFYLESFGLGEEKRQQMMSSVVVHVIGLVTEEADEDDDHQEGGCDLHDD
jgi:G3E family GTPase